MNNRKREDDQENESLFERQFRHQFRMKQARDDVLFFGIAIMSALLATQEMFYIQ